MHKLQGGNKMAPIGGRKVFFTYQVLRSRLQPQAKELVKALDAAKEPTREDISSYIKQYEALSELRDVDKHGAQKKLEAVLEAWLRKDCFSEFASLIEEY